MSIKVENIYTILSNHFSLKLKQIMNFAQTGYLFEEWINWEIFTAFEKKDFKIYPRPTYNRYFHNKNTRIQGDILCEKDNEQIFIEVGLIHTYTKNKWLKKLTKDRDKLKNQTPSSNKNIRKVQLIISCSTCEKNLKENWLPWYNNLNFWNQPAQEIILNQGVNGEAFIKIWDV
ncbi:hypothetical protein LGZ99_05340 [Photorhabdus temperata]|uniref:hypothetical protein n=1 Tax=Photorhabdus temperata TaxID=574560 RepID=UPI0021D4F391|nr:hypothetical protein [Photorhabdus temperata]MCT8346652.1 hypothetical protein [Photorhabdus temperata]